MANDNTPIWYPSNNLIAQLAHFGWGALIVLCFGIFGYPGYGVLAAMVWASLKEWVFDIVIEKDSHLSSLEDYIFYILGTGFGYGILMLAFALAALSN